ncbi:hypothetical protein ACFIQF_13120 [Comamonas sp. J-3]|uniref:hypothetical protein n=1 Tax=Comamonas trifloxystrobinivorans TaxID=3350256 RepID=UPI00372B7890
MEKKETQFDISVVGDKIRVRRTLVLPQGSIDLDLTYKHTTPREQLTLQQIHESSVDIAIRHLQSLLPQK